MSTSDLTLAEQLSALMDGELPEAQARFLRRRLEHDAELRAAWSRMQLASSCLKGHRVQAMALDCAAIRADERSRRRPLLGWAVAASAAVLAVALAPRFGTAPDAGQAAPAALAASSTPRLLPTPAAADLVAVRNDAAVASAAPDADAVAATSVAMDPLPANSALVAATPADATSSPLSLASDSPADFPLVDTGDKRWPRSGLGATGSDPALEAYLVRHNQMLAADALGGFVPYVDVVARDPARSAAEAALPAAAPEAASK